MSSHSENLGAGAPKPGKFCKRDGAETVFLGSSVPGACAQCSVNETWVAQGTQCEPRKTVVCAHTLMGCLEQGLSFCHLIWNTYQMYCLVLPAFSESNTSVMPGKGRLLSSIKDRPFRLEHHHIKFPQPGPRSANPSRGPSDRHDQSLCRREKNTGAWARSCAGRQMGVGRADRSTTTGAH